MNFIALIVKHINAHEYEKAQDVIIESLLAKEYQTGPLKKVITFYEKIITSRSNAVIKSSFPLMSMQKKYLKGACTVIIPCYNEQELILNTLNSLKKETTVHRIICVDDASTDSTLLALNDYAASDGRVLVVRNKVNSGLGATRNIGLLLVSTEFCCFIDSDDPIKFGGVDRRVEAASELTEDFEIGVYGSCEWIYGQEWYEGNTSRSNNSIKPVTFLSTGGECPFNANQPLFRTELLQGCGGFPEDRRTAEDWPFWLSILRNGYVIRPTEFSCVTYRQKPNSMIRSTAKEHVNFASKYMNLVEIFDDAAFFSKGLSSYRIKRSVLFRALQFYFMGYFNKFENIGSFISTIVCKTQEIIKIISSELISYLSSTNTDNTDLALDITVKDVKMALLSGAARGFCIPVAEAKQYIEFIDLVDNISLNIVKYFENSYLHNFNIFNKIPVNYDIIFIPHKKYHVYTIASLVKFLKNENISYLVCDISSLYRDEGVSNAIRDLNLPVLSLPKFLLTKAEFRLCVCFNDWDKVVKPFIYSAKKQGIKTIGIIEGVNDYYDIDTNRQRDAYRSVDAVFLPGNFEKKFFKDSETYVCGLQRLDPILQAEHWRVPTDLRSIDVIVNVNFTYGVLEQHREHWVHLVYEACKDAGVLPLFSFHPQDFSQNQFGQIALATEDLLDLLPKSKILITRFSGAVYEALLSGVNVIYFNPNIEKNDYFHLSTKAFKYVTSKEALKIAIIDSIVDGFILDNIDHFVKDHLNLNLHASQLSSGEQTVVALKKLLACNKVGSYIPPLVFSDEYSKINGID
jgi:glycosyltransferase involved in cell wall biosynthesis